MLGGKDTQEMTRVVLIASLSAAVAYAVRAKLICEAKRWMRRLAFLITPSFELVCVVVVYAYMWTLAFLILRPH